MPILPSHFDSFLVVSSRRDKVLRHDVEACDDPVCSCEPEPRWLRLQQQRDFPQEVSEWESIERSPNEEL